MKKTIRSATEKKDLENHLSRIIGQLQGVKKMIEDDKYCGDILIQLSAANKSIQSLSNSILDRHLHTCVKTKLREDPSNEEVLDEVMTLFKRFL